MPHRLNDVWEFDLPSLTWAMLYAPDLNRGYVDLGKDTSDCEFKDGILITKHGGPAVIAHTWWGLTYDPRKKALLFMNTWVTDRKQAVRDLGAILQLYDGPPLWAFFPAERKWGAAQSAEAKPDGDLRRDAGVCAGTRRQHLAREQPGRCTAPGSTTSTTTPGAT